MWQRRGHLLQDCPFLILVLLFPTFLAGAIGVVGTAKEVGPEKAFETAWYPHDVVGREMMML